MPPSKSNIVLDDDQKFALMKFRRSVHDALQPHHNDYFLLRWLRARSWNSEAAEKMLRQSLKWRREFGVDDDLKTWQPPEVISLYQPSGVSGFDEKGSPVLIVPFGGLDIVGLLHSAPKHDMIKATIQILEKVLDMAAETGGNKIVVVFDMDNFNLKQYAWRPAAEVVIQLIKMYEANYPEILKACYIVNAPRVFAIAFGVVKKFLNELTIGKIYIFKHDPKKWKKVLLDNIDPNSLPEFYGGNLKDADGNPRYTSKIQQGGKVPESYYLKNIQHDTSVISDDKEFVSTVIKKGEKLVLDFIVAEEGCFLRWDFSTDGHDIRFGITVRDADGNISPAVRHSRVASHQVDETGALSCQTPATYMVTFDNSYSLLRSKKIRYMVYISTPFKELNMSEDGEVASSQRNSVTEESNNGTQNIKPVLNSNVVHPVH